MSVQHAEELFSVTRKTIVFECGNKLKHFELMVDSSTPSSLQQPTKEVILQNLHGENES